MKLRQKKTEKLFMQRIFELSGPSVMILRTGLPIIAVELLHLLGCFLPELESSPSYVLSVYPPMVEYILNSLVLLIGGALFTDYIVKNNS